MTSRTPLWSFLAGLCLLLPLPSAATTYHVAIGGQDTAAGTASAPWQTIQRALTTAGAGDTIKIGIGTFYERLTPPTSGVTLEGTGNWQTTIDGSLPTSGWVADGQGVWRTTLPFVPWAMTAGGHTIWRISDLIMAKRWTEFPDGLTLLRKPADAKTGDSYVGVRLYWDGVDALFGYRNGTTYFRHRSGVSPATMDVRAAPAGGTITLRGTSKMVVRNMRIVGGQHAVHLTGGATENVVEHCYLTNGYARVMIDGGARANTIRNNEITMHTLSPFEPGEWNRSTYARAVMFSIYWENKFTVGTSSSSPWFSDENDTGVQVQGQATNNVIACNTIHHGVVGIKINESDGTQILGNTIHHMSAQGIFPHLLRGRLDIGHNLLYDNDHNIRIQYMEHSKTVYIYANRFFEPKGDPTLGDGGKHIHFSFLTCGEGGCPTTTTVWIYHNSFAGGGWAVDGGGKKAVMKNVHLVNNVFSTRGLNSTYPGSGFEVASNLSTSVWRTTTLPDWLPPAAARNAGRLLSHLPGMTAAYYGDGKPDIGAWQVGSVAP